MQDVAEAAGVSLSTVSYALNGKRPISDETRDRVGAAIERLGYTPNAAARTLAARRSHVLALVLPPVAGGLGATIGQFIEGATATAEQAGYTLVIWPFSASQRGKIDELARRGLADGVLVMEVSLDDPRIDALEQAGVPVAMIGRTRALEGRAWVDVDFEATVADAVDRLVALGHRHVALINHSQALLDDLYGPAVRTRDAFAEAARRHGLVAQHMPCDETPVAGQAAVAAILAADPAVTAFVTLNETATFGVVAELAHRRRPIPDAVSVLGIATSPLISTMSTPPLTSLQIPGADLGRAAVVELVGLIEHRPPREHSRLIPCTFADGGSLAPAAPTTTESE